MKRLMINPLVCTLFFTILSINSLFAQKIIDSTTNFDFGDVCISHLMMLKEALLYDDSISSKDILISSNFKKDDSCVNYYVNTKSRRTIEFCETPIKNLPMKDTYNNKYALVFRGKSEEFKEKLEDFIRLQKLNEHLSVDEYKDELLIGFFDIYQKARFFVSIQPNNYCLVVL